ncbi:MAG: ABC transporter permease subunit [Anaerolineae bacterium]
MNNQVTDDKDLYRPKAVRIILILVAITVALSLLYAIQYYLGGPIRLSVVSPFYDLSLSPDGRQLAAGTEDGEVLVWQVPAEIQTRLPADFDITTEAPWRSRTLSGHDGAIIEVAFSPQGSDLLTIDREGVVRVWQPAIDNQGSVVATVGGRRLVDADVSGDFRRLATVDQAGVVQVWDVERGSQVRSFEAIENDSQAVALSADGRLVAAGNGANALVWDVDSGELVQTLEGRWEDSEEQADWLGHQDVVTALAFSPDSALLASGSADTTVIFWDLETGDPASLSEGHWATVTVITFDASGDFVLTGGRDNKVRNIRVASGRSTVSYEGHLSAVYGTAYGPDDTTILSASGDGTVRVWETTNSRLLHIEWSRYGFQPTWGPVLALWLLISGLLGLVALWGLWNRRTWSHLLTVAIFLIGPVAILGLPLFEVMSYPLTFGLKLQIAWPLIVLAVWYFALLFALLREPVVNAYAAPADATLSEQIMIGQRTAKTRFGIYSLAVWIGLLVVVYSVLRRFNLDIAFMGHFFSFIMAGAGLTVLVSALSIALAVVLALLGALGRLSSNPIPNGIAGFYISLIRGTPLLVQIFIWYLGLPQLGIILQPIAAGVLALGVNYGAYMTEIFRAGIQAISKGQQEAAQALGMSGTQTFRRVILPQAFRIVIPPIGNDFIAMMKDSSLVYIMGVWELTFRAQKIGRQNFRTMETFIIAAGFYWLLTVVFQFLQGKLETYMARGERK